MKPCISFDDVSLTPVDKTSYRYDQKRKKDVKLKKPVIKKSKSIHIGDCHDLFELISFLDNHMAYDVDNPSQIHYGYTEWRTNTWSLWEQVNNCFLNLEAI